MSITVVFYHGISPLQYSSLSRCPCLSHTCDSCRGYTNGPNDFVFGARFVPVGGGIKMVNLVLVPLKTLLCHRKFKRFRYFSYIVSCFLFGLNLLSV